MLKRYIYDCAFRKTLQNVRTFQTFYNPSSGNYINKCNKIENYNYKL